MTLREKQVVFVKRLIKLLQFAFDNGYEITLGEAMRSHEEATRLSKLGLGIIGSLHESRLAIDLMLFKNGVWLTKTEDYLPLGRYWESLSKDGIECAWGGRFSDANHFSIASGGKR